MLKHMNASDRVEVVGGIRRVRNVSDKNLSAAAGAGALGDFVRHFDAEEFPTIARKRREERAGTAAKVEDAALMLIAADGFNAAAPALDGSFAGGRDCAIVI